MKLMDQRSITEAKETNNDGVEASRKSKLPSLPDDSNPRKRIKFMDQRSITEAKETKYGGVEALPDDLIIEILLRSPVKSLGRFRCVSKQFCSLLSDPKFARKQIELTLQKSNSENHRLIMCVKKLVLVDFDSISVKRQYPFKEDLILFSESPKGWCIPLVGSSYGLVCVKGKESVLLYNPVTRESKRVPKVPEFLHCKKTHQKSSSSSYGFGFDSLTNDYKVVILVSCKEDDENKHSVGYVYSLKTNSWRMISNLLPYYDTVYNSSEKIKGAIHWIVRIREGYEYQKMLIAFDLNKEEFREMSSLPDWPDESECLGAYRVEIFKGCLCVVRNRFWMYNDIWVMKEYGIESSWSMIRIKVSECTIKSLCLITNDEEVLPLLDGHLLYLKTKYGSNEELYVRIQTNSYVESLISPNSYGEKR